MHELQYSPSDQMELQYLYIYEHFNIIGSDLNFGHRVKARLERTDDAAKLKLVIEDNAHYIPSFFGKNIINATAIVGNNGAGKTLLTKYIQNFLDNKVDINANWLAIFYHPTRNSLIIYDWIWDRNLEHSSDDPLKKPAEAWHKLQYLPLENRSAYRIEYAPNNQSGDQHARAIENNNDDDDEYPLKFGPYLFSKCIYYNPFFEVPDEPTDTELIGEGNALDVSSGNVAFNEWDQPGDYTDELHRYKAANQKRQLIMINELAPPKFHDKGADTVFASVNWNAQYKLDKSEAQRKIRYFLEDKFRTEEVRYSAYYISSCAPKSELAIKAIKKSIVREFVILIIAVLLAPEKNLNSGKVIEELTKCKSTGPITVLNHFLNHFFKKEKKDFMPFVRLVLESIREAKECISRNIWVLKGETALKLWDLHDEFIKLEYTETNVINFECAAFSSGEIGMLNLYSRLQYGIKRCNAREGSVIYFFIDEGETGFHPVWQKEYFHDLVQFLQAFAQYTFYLIICTHSPIVVSDFPSGNLILLQLHENGYAQSVNDLDGIKQTFGANIHTLLANSFFMQGAPVGKFAQLKIDAAFEWMQSDDKEGAEEINTFISLIDEPLIKVKLREMFARKMGTTYEKQRIQEKIKQLQEQLKTLEQS